MKVGDYIRTDKGEIGKVISIANDNDFGLGKEYSGSVAFNTEPYVYGDIIKISPNIIDLIEVGDYVNGMYIQEIKSLKDNIMKCMVDSDYECITTIKNSEIGSVLTKEQFESMEYKVGE